MLSPLLAFSALLGGSLIGLGLYFGVMWLLDRLESRWTRWLGPFMEFLGFTSFMLACLSAFFVFSLVVQLIGKALA